MRWRGFTGSLTHPKESGTVKMHQEIPKITITRHSPCQRYDKYRKLDSQSEPHRRSRPRHHNPDQLQLMYQAAEEVLEAGKSHTSSYYSPNWTFLRRRLKLRGMSDCTPHHAYRVKPADKNRPY